MLSGEVRPEMDEEEAAVTSYFWKFMWPGFHEQLMLPPDFCRKLKEKEEVSNRAILRSDLGQTKVHVCKNEEGKICLKEGWKDFAHINGLIVGDVLVFEHTGGFHFNVTVFDETRCEKELPQGENVDKCRKLAKKKTVTDSITSYYSPTPHFPLIMKPHNGSKSWATVNIPAKFLRSNDLSRKTSATLRDSRGKAWPVKLTFTKSGYIRCLMSRGWYAFYKSNKLKDGDVCVFELHPHSRRSNKVVMDVKVFRGDAS